jgi:hypothetical protein
MILLKTRTDFESLVRAAFAASAKGLDMPPILT